MNGSFEFIEGEDYIADAKDLTDLLGNNDQLYIHQNELALFKGLEVSSISYKNDPGTDDIYLSLRKEGVDYSFTVEYYLRNNETDVYKAVQALNVGDVVDIEAYLYWYGGPNPHVVGVTVHQENVAQAIFTEGNLTLSFTYDRLYTIGETFNGATITALWSGDEVTSSGDAPGWAEYYSASSEVYYELIYPIQKVVFYESFSQVRCTSTASWFKCFDLLKTIEGLSYLNTSAVTNMSWMFENCRCLESIDLSSFDTSTVTSMRGMFALEYPIGEGESVALRSLNLRSFDTSQVCDMAYMFSGCKQFSSLDLNHFDTSNVTDMTGMFAGCYSLTSLDLYNFDTSKVTSMANMFNMDCPAEEGAGNLTELHIEGFDTSGVTNMALMFSGCNKLQYLDIRNFNTSNVTNMCGMFSNCRSLSNIDLSGFDTSNVSDMNRMFCWCCNLTTLDVSTFNTSKVTDMTAMFGSCFDLTNLDLSNFDTTSVQTMRFMFGMLQDNSTYTSQLRVLDLSGFNTSNVANILGMFNFCENLETIFCDDSDSLWSLSEIAAEGQSLFYNCDKLKGQYGSISAGYTENNIGINYAKSAKFGGYFTPKYMSISFDANGGTGSMTDQLAFSSFYDPSGTMLSEASFTRDNYTFAGWNTEADGSGTAYSDRAPIAPSEDLVLYAQWKSSEEKVAQAIWTEGNLTLSFTYDRLYSIGEFFNGETITDLREAISSTELGWDDFDDYQWSSDVKTVVVYKSFSNVKPISLRRLFCCFESLETIDGIQHIDTSNLTEVEYMFYGCSALTSLDLSSFDTSKVTSMRSMFEGCIRLTSLNVSSFDTTSVTCMHSMFYGCRRLSSLDLSRFDTSNVTDMAEMFYNCSGLTSLDVSSFNTSKVTDMTSIFYGCSGQTGLNLSSFDTSNVTEMGGMFKNCSNLISLDLSGFNAKNVTNMSYLFSNCSGLTNLDLSGFDTSNVIDMHEMFFNCSGLTSLDLGSFNTSKVTNMTSMFYGCSSLTDLVLCGFNTTKVKSLCGMFRNCSSLTRLDLSSFDTACVTDMQSMFYGCSSLTNLDLSGFDTASVTIIVSIF